MEKTSLRARFRTHIGMQGLLRAGSRQLLKCPLLSLESLEKCCISSLLACQKPSLVGRIVSASISTSAQLAYFYHPRWWVNLPEELRVGLINLFPLRDLRHVESRSNHIV